MPKGSLTDAANFIATEARQLSILSLLYALDPLNIEGLQRDNISAWQRASHGWAPVGGYYQKRKERLSGQGALGVYSGGWMEYRTLASADIVIRERKGNAFITFAAATPIGDVARKKRAYNTQKKPAKAWRNYPQRMVDLEGAHLTVRDAVAIPASDVPTITAAIKKLPLSGLNITYKAIKNKRVGNIRKSRAKLQPKVERAINAV